MREIILAWKENSVGFDKFVSWCKNQTDKCAGAAAYPEFLMITFSEDIDEETKNLIVLEWENVTPTSHPYVSKSAFEDAILALKADMVSKNYDQLSAVQKKILLGLPVSNEELGL